MVDDRQDFLRQRRDRAAALGGDPAVRELDAQLLAASDRHDWSYQWLWLGVPIIQMPTDVMATQELIWQHRPQVIVETGVARGGSAVFHASMLQLLGEGHVVAVDIDIRPHNRETVQSHPLAHRITLVEGPSTAPEVLRQVAAATEGVERVMVVLDSDHTHDHVLAELEAYAGLVTAGQYLVVADTLIEQLPPQEHRPRAWGPGNNPATAVSAYLAAHPEFERDAFVDAKLLLTSSRGGYLRRR